jgi:excisionase family DNA binding protein
MTVEAAVAFTGIARSNLYEAMRKGELPYSQPGRRRLIPRRALVDLLQKHMVGLPVQKS